MPYPRRGRESSSAHAETEGLSFIRTPRDRTVGEKPTSRGSRQTLRLEEASLETSFFSLSAVSPPDSVRCALPSTPDFLPERKKKQKKRFRASEREGDSKKDREVKIQQRELKENQLQKETTLKGREEEEKVGAI